MPVTTRFQKKLNIRLAQDQRNGNFHNMVQCTAAHEMSRDYKSYVRAWRRRHPTALQDFEDAHKPASSPATLAKPTCVAEDDNNRLAYLADPDTPVTVRNPMAGGNWKHDRPITIRRQLLIPRGRFKEGVIQHRCLVENPHFIPPGGMHKRTVGMCSALKDTGKYIALKNGLNAKGHQNWKFKLNPDWDGVERGAVSELLVYDVPAHKQLSDGRPENSIVTSNLPSTFLPAPNTRGRRP